jgi:hypothetical protein
MENFDDIFQRSFARVMGEGAYNPAFTGRFYEIFLRKSPDIAARFANTDMSAQKTMLHDSLHTLIDFYHNKSPTPALRRLAAAHGRARHDIPAGLYQAWLDALVATVAEFDAEFSGDTELAWRLVMTPGICYMTFNYDR